MPAGIWLTKFGTIVREYFGHVPYHVGSSLDSKTWRDVDVRLILPDFEFEALYGTNPSSGTNGRLAAITLAFSALGKEMTGLPIDFQIQPMSHANNSPSCEGPRSALIEMDEEPPAVACTGFTARWCPTHGDCSCAPGVLDHPQCPLHGVESTHAEGGSSDVS